MQTSDYITKDIKALSPNDTIEKAQKLFEQLTFTHLPVVEEQIYLGSIAEEDVQIIEENHKKIAEFKYLYQPFFTVDNTNWFELLKEFASHDTSIIPAINNKKKYVGYFELTDILHVFNNTPFLSEAGAILVVSKPIKDYSFSEISQIVESNNGQLLGAFISSIENEIVEITIKLNNLDLNNTIQSFRRYEYTIITGIHEDEYLNSLKERSAYLQKYLNM
jgi:predicted transcriptional regulator